MSIDPQNSEQRGRTFYDPETGASPAETPFYQLPLQFTPDGKVQLSSEQKRDLSSRADQLLEKNRQEASLQDLKKLRHEIRREDVSEHGLEYLLQFGTYPCLKIDVQHEPTNEDEKQTVRRLAQGYLNCAPHDIVALDSIQEISNAGEEIFQTATFQRPASFAVTHAFESLDQKYDLKFSRHLHHVFRVRLRDGREYWFQRDQRMPLVDIGRQIFSAPKGLIDANDYLPPATYLSPGLPTPGVQQVIGENTNYEQFYRQLVSWAEQRYKSPVDQRFSLKLLGVGVPGVSGPIIMVEFKDGRSAEYVSGQQIVQSSLNADTFKRLKDALKNPINSQEIEKKSDGVRGLLRRLFRSE